MSYRDPNDEYDDNMIDDNSGDDDFSENNTANTDNVLPERKETTAERQRKSRRSVESYLEKKRLREELESVFDEDDESLELNLDEMDAESLAEIQLSEIVSII